MPFLVMPTGLPEVLLLQPTLFGDNRGFFYESFNARDFEKCTGLDCTFVQDNHSKSAHGVLRGLHYQIRHPQGKLVRVVSGAVFDVAVDMRKASPNFGKWTGTSLSAQNNHQLWIPAGFAHGFFVLSEFAEFLYKTTDYWYPEDEQSIRWNDPQIGVEWPLNCHPLLSKKDEVASLLADAAVFEA